MNWEQFFKEGALMMLPNRQLVLGYDNAHWSNQPKNQKCFYFPDFFLKDPKPYLCFDNYLECPLDQLFFQLSKIDCSFDLRWETKNEAEFNANFLNLKGLFQKNILKKAVPYIFQYTSNKMIPLLLQYLLKNSSAYCKNNHTYLYGFWNDSEGIIGATPELLFRLDSEKRLSTMACAGTFYENTNITSKELKEHQIVVEEIIQTFSHYGQISCSSLKQVPFGSIKHLITEIHIDLSRSVDFAEMIHLMHPTSALGGSPKKEAINWLKSYDLSFERTRYGAPVGWINEQKNECFSYVAIRNIQWNHHGLRIGAGAGVIAESNLEQEWSEIQCKFNAIHQLFKI